MVLYPQCGLRRSAAVDDQRIATVTRRGGAGAEHSQQGRHFSGTEPFYSISIGKGLFEEVQM